jgi:thiamine-monophosphate kinase
VSRRPFGVTALGPGREFDRIRQIARALGRRAVELGNDCALIPAGAGTLALSTDTSVEGVHFRLDWLTLAEVGWRAAAAALSDLAAAGVEPAGLLAAAVVPPSAGDEDLVALMGGVGAAGASVGASVIGGDLSSGPLWMVTITVLGRATAPLTRVGARPGDGVWVTGTLGAARAALEAWRRGAAPSTEARIAFAHPQARIAAGRWLAEHGAHAMMDLSDGLAGDAPHLAAASEVSLELALESLPVASAAIEEAQRLQVPAQQFAAEGGEDYELLAALPFEFGPAQASDFERACGIALTRIGSVESGKGVRVRLAGRLLTLRGYDHFS